MSDIVVLPIKRSGKKSRSRVAKAASTAQILTWRTKSLEPPVETAEQWRARLLVEFHDVARAVLLATIALKRLGERLEG